MINLKPKIYKLLKNITKNVVESYPDSNFDWNNSLPLLIYEEENNTPHTITTDGESMTLLRYRIEIYSKESTSLLKTKIDTSMTELGFTRGMCLDQNDIGNRRHTIMRYEGVVDLANEKIYKN